MEQGCRGEGRHQQAMVPPGRVDVMTDQAPALPGVQDRPASGTGFARSGGCTGLRGASGGLLEMGGPLA